MTYSTCLGIDVSKDKCDFCIQSSNNNILNSGTFLNNSLGISELMKSLNKLKSKSHIIVIESTGDYHLLLSITLLNQGFNVSVINPLITKKYLNSSIRKIKTDKSDTKLLSDIGFKESNLPNFKSCINSILKTKICVLISTLEKHLTAIKLALKNFNETGDKLGINLPYEELEESIKSLNNSIRGIETFLESIVENKDVLESLSKVKGITKTSASKIIAMIEDKDFNNRSAAIAYAGMDISVKQSGKFVGKSRMTKRENSCIRKNIYQIAWGLVMHNDKFSKLYEYYRSKGRKYKETLMIIGRKILRIIYKLLKTGSRFDENLLKFIC